MTKYLPARKTIWGVTLMILSLSLYAQPYAIGHTTITFQDASRSNRSVPTEIYYPADSAGDNVSITAITTDDFPVLAFGHGFVMGWDSYQSLWEALVPKGYIMAFPKTEGSLSPSHAEFGKDLSFVINQINGLGASTGSIFAGRVAELNAVMGHSMGGGAAFLAAQSNPSIKSILTLAAAETNPSAIAAAANISIPALVFAGQNDCVTPPAGNQVAMYNALNSSCKTYLEIIGGSHCQMADSNFLCNFGEATCTPQATITRAQQQAVLNQFAASWLEAQLKLNCDAGAIFNTELASDLRISFERNCLQCVPLSSNADAEKKSKVLIGPNPFGSLITIHNENRQRLEVTLRDSSSRSIMSASITNEATEINAEFLSSGIYFYTITSEDGFREHGKIIKE